MGKLASFYRPVTGKLIACGKKSNTSTCAELVGLGVVKSQVNAVGTYEDHGLEQWGKMIVGKARWTAEFSHPQKNQ